jgi:hypothetical protein
MPRVYAKVSIEMWGDQRFGQLSPLKPSGQALWIYLLSGRFRTSIPGLNLNVGIGALSDRLKWRVVDVEHCWQEIEALKMAEADWGAGVVWLPKGIGHNEPESPNVIKGWGKLVLPECPLITKALGSLYVYIDTHLSEAYAKAFMKAFPKAFPKALREGFGDTFAKGSPNQDQDQEQEQEPTPQPPSSRGARLTRQELKHAKQARHSLGRCFHEPVCISYQGCIERIAVEARLRGASA